MKDADADRLVLRERSAFVLGNGPSLKSVNLKELSPFATIGMNAAYRYWDRIGWRPTHYTCLDLVVGLSHIESIRKLIREGRETAGEIRPIGRFLLRRNLIEALGPDADDARVLNFDALRLRTPLFQVDPITTGSHALLWARLEGFDPVVLLGIDGQYQEIVAGAERREGIVLEITEKKPNPNYFFEDYQQPGDRFNLPNPHPELHLNAWRAAAAALRTAGARVANGNPASAVRIFPFVPLDELLEAGVATLRPAGEVPLCSSADSMGSRASPLLSRLTTAPVRPAFLAGPAVVAALVGAAWAAGVPGLAVFLSAMLSAASLVLLLHLLGVALPRLQRRLSGRSGGAESAVMLDEFARQFRIMNRGQSHGDRTEQ